MTKVEDNRIKEILVKVVDVDTPIEQKEEKPFEALIEKHKKKRQKKNKSDKEKSED